MWLITGILSLLAWGQLGVFCGLTALDDTIGDICLDVKLQSGFGMTNFVICTYISIHHITSIREQIRLHFLYSASVLHSAGRPLYFGCRSRLRRVVGRRFHHTIWLRRVHYPFQAG